MAARDHGITSPVMYQRWSDLAFLHWRWDVADLQRRLPPGLHVDTHEGAAWLGIVPFYMQRIRPRFLPPLPWVSWFLELNVRTYVHDDHGTPGVWFFSLDCNQPLAVITARTFFKLPYFHARMNARHNEKGVVHYECARQGQREGSSFDYRRVGDVPAPQPGSLEFFLVERYVLFAETHRGLRVGRVQHVPYQLARLELSAFDDVPLLWNGFASPQRAPDHVIGSAGVDVRIGPLEKPRATA